MQLLRFCRSYNIHMRTRVVVLAAGRGTRMKSELPKVLVPLAGRRIASISLDPMQSIGINKPARFLLLFLDAKCAIYAA